MREDANDTDDENRTGSSERAEGPGEDEFEAEGGPLGRIEAFMDLRLAEPEPTEEEAEEPPEAEAVEEEAAEAPETEASPAEQVAGRLEARAAERPAEEDAEAGLPSDYRPRLVAEYRKRQQERLEAETEEEDAGNGDAGDGGVGTDGGTRNADTDGGVAEPATYATDEPAVGEAPQPPPANNWVPIGPSVVRQGQAAGTPPMAGRVDGVAVAPGGNRMYAASANGGVWRSDDGGTTWHSTMEAWDRNPTTASSDSLACGAIAVDPTDPDRVYVGTGEGDTAFVRGGSVVGTGAYFGVGPIRSDDAGNSWHTESSSPTLAGQAFYELAVDPADTDRVVGATTRGLYRREPDGSGGFHWDRKRSGVHSSVVVARSGSDTVFYAAEYGGSVFRSTDGDTWTSAGTSFPTSDVGRVGVAVAPSNPDVVYALVATASDMKMRGIWRLDDATGSGTWRQVSGVPTALFGTGPVGQGWYDLSIAVDPTDVDRIYVGGSTEPTPGVSGPETHSAALRRCTVSSSGSGSSLSYSMTTDYVGGSVHADIHELSFTPGDNTDLWVGTDGGVFFADDAPSGANFAPRNTGLATVTMEHIGQHPTEDAVAFVGTQDNGTVRFTGDECWLHMAPGDGGFSVVNWADPYRVVVSYPGNVLRRYDDGGSRYSYTHVSPPIPSSEPEFFYAPLAGTPRNPGNPGEADRIAVASTRPYVSDDFGDHWSSLPAGSIPTTNRNHRVISLSFASHDRLYVGTLNGRVYRYDETASGWSGPTRLDNTGGSGNTLAFGLPVTDIAVDSGDPSGDSIYVTVGGVASDYRRVWHFDGSQWTARSGPSSGSSDSLLDVHHNAIVVDPADPDHLYAGADIGVWHSADAGSTWEVFSFGLPDAAVIDLKTHPEHHLLRAATHGRGVYEYELDAATKPGVELYVRDTLLDRGRSPTTDGLPDPTDPGASVSHENSPDVKLDAPDSMGQYQFPAGVTPNFHEFVDELDDDADQVPVDAGVPLVTRVYVQVHNRGVTTADDVRVMLLVADASGSLPPLPSNYDVNVRSGVPVTGGGWQTVGIRTLDDVAVGLPRVAQFDLSSSSLSAPGGSGTVEHALVALVHHATDPYTATETDVDANTVDHRKATQKHITVVDRSPGTGTLPIYRRGDHGRDVKTIQFLLQEHGHSLSADGIFGPVTENRVFSFQIDNGLAADGVVGPNTWEQLFVTVHRGSVGPAVRAVQDQLRITVDGIFGPGTESAVETFQSDQGLAVDGVVGPDTWRALILD